MYNHSYPKKINTAFIKTVATNYEIDLDFNRKEGYSILLKSVPQKRWMMIDMNDQPNEQSPHLIVVIDIKPNSINEDEVEQLTQLPIKTNRKRETCFWINQNRDAIHLMFCDDHLAYYDFNNDRFLQFLEQVYLSFKAR
ncbi:hypothetical protein [Niallia sp. Krafla_26]|uniref:hypothetical protein n=1 Tax=Niallia sp. Krafla_26 TaxID=3064703 RepID=UPI003D169402